MTLRRRLGLALAAILALFAVNIGVYFWGISARADALEVVGRAAERQLLTVRLGQQLSDLRRLIDLTLQSTDASTPLPGGMLTGFDDGVRAARAYAGDLARGIDPDHGSALPDLTRSMEELFSAWQRMIKHYGVDATTAITEQVRAEGLARQVVDRQVPALELAERQLAGQARAESRRVAWFTISLAGAIFLASVVLALLVGHAVSRQLTGGLRILQRGAEAIGGGNLDFRIAVPQADELGELARGFNDMAEKLGLARTALAENARELELFFRLINQTDDALLILTREGRIVQANAAACASLGIHPGSVAGQSLRDHPGLFRDDSGWDRFSRRMEGKGSARLEWLVRRADGTEFPAEISARRVTSGDQDYFVVVARDITHSLELRERLRELSRQDSLTGVLNRRAFDERLNLEWRRAARHGRSLAVLLIDVDCFKAYNDALGHPAGDRCLKELAQAMTACLRNDVDILARYGGEEFAALLPESGAADAHAVAERLRDAVESLGIEHPASLVGPRVTVSAGFSAGTPTGAETSEALIRRADQALYQAKRAGRNRTRGDGV